MVAFWMVDGLKKKKNEGKKIIKILEQDGWFLARQKGSHRQYKHHFKKGCVTIAGHLNDDLAPGTLNSILKQAGLRR